MEESESETCREDRVVVAVEVDRVSNRVAGAVWVHQEHFYHLGNRENLDWKTVKVNCQN